MIPLSLPIEAISCTSEMIHVDSRRSSESRVGLSIPNMRVTVVSVLSPLGPLHRSLDFIALAEKVASNLPDNPDFSDDWIARLVEDFSQFND